VHNLDLNPVEKLWAIIKRNITTQAIARSIEELEKEVLNKWWSISQETINELIDTMPRGVQAVIDAHGSFTKH